MDEMLMWVERGTENIAISRAMNHADAMRQRGAAIAYSRATGKAVRLVRYVRGQVLEEIEP